MNKLVEEKSNRNPIVLDQPWATAVGAGVGIFTLIFLMALVIFAVLGKPPPESVKFIVITIVSFGLAFSTAFLGGKAVIKGDIPFLPERMASTFSMAGGVAVFLIVFLAASTMYPVQGIKSDVWDGSLASLKSGLVKISNVDDKMIVKVNGTVLAQVDYGYTGSFELKNLLRSGDNSIAVTILNGAYGGCSGDLKFYFNGEEAKGLEAGYQDNFASPNGVCKELSMQFSVK